jgi:hypothetical protein
LEKRQQLFTTSHCATERAEPTCALAIRRMTTHAVIPFGSSFVEQRCFSKADELGMPGRERGRRARSHAFGREAVIAIATK